MHTALLCALPFADKNSEYTHRYVYRSLDIQRQSLRRYTVPVQTLTGVF